MDRAQYNKCLVPYISGTGKSKEERKLRFCVGAKLCSGKSKTEEEAIAVCKLPKPAKPPTTKKATRSKTTTQDFCANIIPMAKWIDGGSEDECRPCMLPPVIQWYKETLEENELTPLTKELEEAVNSGDPGLLSWHLDNIKYTAPDNVKSRLKEFDCHAQLNSNRIHHG